MEHIEDGAAPAGATLAIVTVLRELLHAHPDREALKERLRIAHARAVAKCHAALSARGERAAFEEVFAMLEVQTAEDAGVVAEIRRTGRPPDAATANPTDGVDDASLY